MKRFIFKITPLLIFKSVICIGIAGCSEDERQSSQIQVKTDTVYIEKYKPMNIVPAYAFYGNYNRNVGAYQLKVDVTPKDGLHESMHVMIQKGDSVLVDSILKDICYIEEVHARDLDGDNFPELYIMGRSEGSGGFLCLDIFEASGDTIHLGEMKNIFAPSSIMLTNDMLIHEHWLASDMGWYIGMEFTYFELIDNRFKLVEKKDWIHRKGQVVNRSKFED